MIILRVYSFQIFDAFKEKILNVLHVFPMLGNRVSGR